MRKSSRKQKYTIQLSDTRLLYGCSLQRAFPFVIRRLGELRATQYAKSYEGAAQWILKQGGILVKEKSK